MSELNKPLISVIIPVYNVEKYLRQCLDSILCQPFREIEVICVNDVSTDNSYAILDEYAKKDNRIIILNNSGNIGLGLTRNNGLKIAKGKYVHFIDSDDWVKHDIYTTCYPLLEEHLLDYIEFRCQNYSEKEKKYYDVIPYHSAYTGKVVNPNYYPELFNNFEAVPERIFNRNFLIDNNIVFNAIRRFEDTPFWVECLLKAQKILFLSEPYYFYRVDNVNSLIGTKYKVFNCYFEWFNLLKMFVITHKEEKYAELLINRMFMTLYGEYDKFLYCDLIGAYKYWEILKEFVKNEELTDFNGLYKLYKLKTAEIKKCNFAEYFLRNWLKKYMPFLYQIMLQLKNSRKNYGSINNLFY